MGYFKGKQFERDIILVAVGYYCRFSLSYQSHIRYSTSQNAGLSSSLYVLYETLVIESLLENQQFITAKRLLPYFCAFKKLKHNELFMCLYKKHCTVKHFNNLIEQDHRHIKRRFAKSVGFQNLRHASRTIKGIETIHAIYKQNQSSQPNFGFSI